MVIKPSLLFGDVMHTRLFPAQNSFLYKIFYIAISLDDLPKLNYGFLFGVNRPALMSFWNKDHGDRSFSKDPNVLKSWLCTVFKDNNILFDMNDSIVLITMPRVFGYVFNPISFWLCYNNNNQLKTVLAEVNNTFGETHSYICVLDKDKNVNSEEWVEAEKVFHVSPFLPRNGFYKFRFKTAETKLSFQIDYYDKNHKKQLVTLLKGSLHDMGQKNLLRAFFGYPLITVRAVYLIHWQALKLWFKRQKFYKKPKQNSIKTSISYQED